MLCRTICAIRDLPMETPLTSHIFINIFHTVHFSAVKFTRGNEKKMSFLLIPKSPKVWKKSEAIGPGTFKCLFLYVQSLNDLTRHFAITINLIDRPYLLFIKLCLSLTGHGTCTLFVCRSIILDNKPTIAILITQNYHRHWS